MNIVYKGCMWVVEGLSCKPYGHVLQDRDGHYHGDFEFTYYAKVFPHEEDLDPPLLSKIFPLLLSNHHVISYVLSRSTHIALIYNVLLTFFFTFKNFKSHLFFLLDFHYFFSMFYVGINSQIKLRIQLVDAIKGFQYFLVIVQENIHFLFSNNKRLIRGLMKFQELIGNKNVGGLLKWTNDMVTTQVCTTTSLRFFYFLFLRENDNFARVICQFQCGYSQINQRIQKFIKEYG